MVDAFLYPSEAGWLAIADAMGWFFLIAYLRPPLRSGSPWSVWQPEMLAPPCMNECKPQRWGCPRCMCFIGGHLTAGTGGQRDLSARQ